NSELLLFILHLGLAPMVRESISFSSPLPMVVRCLSNFTNDISWLDVRIRRFQILLTDSWLTSSRYFLPSADNFSDGPRLGDAAARSEWRVAIKDLNGGDGDTRAGFTYN